MTIEGEKMGNKTETYLFESGYHFIEIPFHRRMVKRSKSAKLSIKRTKEIKPNIFCHCLKIKNFQSDGAQQ